MDGFKVTGIHRMAHPAVSEVGSVYAVTALHSADVRRTRMFGYFFLEETARKAVEENWLDMYECGHYDHIVIERVSPGIHPVAEEVQWYRWDDTKGWYEIGKTAGSWQPADEKPAALASIVNFCFG